MLTVLSVCIAASPPALLGSDATPSVPASWLAAWHCPCLRDRPLQLVFGISSERANLTGDVSGIRPERASLNGMAYYTDLGLGGIVCSVDFHQYMRSEEHWKTLVAGIDACEALGMAVWLYDEDCYPSGAAGGLVLAENRVFEATVLACDASRTDPFFLRPAYEHTHASNNWSYARRYINLLDDRAVACFIRKTHDAYWQRLQRHFGHTIQAVFTDEPSLMAVDIGQLPDQFRWKVPVVDPLDPNVPLLPTVPWAYDLPDRYRQRYHQDLDSHRRSLFAGDAVEDRQVRRQFWSLVADLVADRYYGQIQRWCAQHRIASSGHTLHEESVLHHIPLDGNKLKVLGQMDIPGMDVLSSDPEWVFDAAWPGWLAAALPASAAALHGRRRVMTEVSDIIQTTTQGGPAGLDAMRATAAWQAAWGVTDFQMYYRPEAHPADDYREYCAFVGRLNALLKPAQPTPEVLLYYPIYDLWAEYRPVAGPLQPASQSPLAQRIIASFMTLGSALQRTQIPFVLIDHEMLSNANAETGAKLTIGGHDFTTLILPDGVELSPSAAAVVDRFRRGGGRVLAERQGAKLSTAALVEAIGPAERLSPASEKIVLGRFVRQQHPILLLVNVGPEPYVGWLSPRRQKIWTRMAPETGAIELVVPDAQGRLPLSLAGRQAALLIGVD